MPTSRWRHVLSLELGWMAPGLAGRYIDACRAAGLLEVDGEELRLTFDAKTIPIPRGFRPDPLQLPPASDGALPATPAAAPMGAEGGPPETSEGDDLFGSWLPKIAAARGEDLGATMAAMEALQAKAGGLLHAEAAILVMGAAAGLDVKAAAARALKDLQA